MKHELIGTGDSDSFKAIEDRHGEVVLSYCRTCKQAEGDLEPECPGRKTGITTAEAVTKSKTAERKKHPLIHMYQVAAICGVNPSMKRADVLREMVRKYQQAPAEPSDNIARDWSRDKFDDAVEQFEGRFKRGIRRCEVSDKLLHANVSLVDGSADKGTGLAFIRVPFGQRSAATRDDFNPLSDQPHMFAQMQVEMHLAKVKWGVFFQWSPLACTHEIVQLDEAFLKHTLETLVNFYTEYKGETKNKEHLEPLRKVIDNQKTRRIIEEIDDLEIAMTNAKARRQELVDELIAMAGDRNCTISGRNLTKTVTNGSISYGRIVKEKLADLDLEPYRGESSTSWKLG